MPEPQPAGALVPPPRNPPTAIATAALPPERPSREIRPRERSFRLFVQEALDALDDVGDSIAHAIGLR